MKKDVQQGEVTGEVFTRPEVVAYMLNSVRHCGKFKSLVGLRVLEPSCGDGAFVLPLVEAWLSEKPDFDSVTPIHSYERVISHLRTLRNCAEQSESGS